MGWRLPCRWGASPRRRSSTAPNGRPCDLTSCIIVGVEVQVGGELVARAGGVAGACGYGRDVFVAAHVVFRIRRRRWRRTSDLRRVCASRDPVAVQVVADGVKLGQVGYFDEAVVVVVVVAVGGVGLGGGGHDVRRRRVDFVRPGGDDAEVVRGAWPSRPLVILWVTVLPLAMVAVPVGLVKEFVVAFHSTS